MRPTSHEGEVRPGMGSAIVRLGREGSIRPAFPAGRSPKNDVETTTRNPLFLFLLSGLFLLRFEQRTFL